MERLRRQVFEFTQKSTLLFSLSLSLHGFLGLTLMSQFETDRKVNSPLGVTIVYFQTSQNRPSTNSPQLVSKVLRKAAATEAFNKTFSNAGNSNKGKNFGITGDLDGVKTSTEQKYLYELLHLIQQKKTYPKSAVDKGLQGKVLVKLTLLKDGRISDHKIVNQSRHQTLNQAATNLLDSLKEFKPIPDVLQRSQWNILIPVEFVLN